MEKSLNAVGYISSTKRNDVERHIELKVQHERILEFCKQRGYVFMKLYEEPKDSSEDYKAELFNLLNDAVSGKFQHVVVLSLDRISLDNVAKVWVTDELKRKGIKLHSLTENLALSPDSEKYVYDKAEQLKSKVKDIPSLPEVVNKVIALIQNPNSSAYQIAKLIANDSGLTSRVLKLVNSAYYGFPKQISSIQHSIAILGFTTIRGLVLSSSIFKIFAPRDNQVKMLDYKKLWKHSLVTALIAKKICSKLAFHDNDDILFSAAILHDMGKIILEQYDHANYISALSDSVDLPSSNNLLAEKKYCGLNHCEVGYLIANNWNLPDAIAETIKCHHDPADASPEYRKMISIISMANLFSILFEKDIELIPEYLSDFDLSELKVSKETIFDIFSYSMTEMKNEQNLDDYLE